MRNANAITMRLTADTFQGLYLEHGPRAQGFFLRMTGYDRELARDLTQDLFMRLWSARESYDPKRPFRTWMFAIAYNMLKNEYRRRMTVMEYVENADKEITLDCQELEYISSSGLRLFLTLRKEAAAKGGKIVIEHINDDIKKVFMITGFFNLFEIR